MGYINKRVSSRSIIARINRTIRPQDSSWLADVIEEIADAIQAIGFHCGFDEKVTPANAPVEITSHRALLPCDYERILFVEELLPGKQTTNLLDAEGNNIYVQEDGSCLQGFRLPLGTELGLKSFSSKGAKRTIAQTPTKNYYDLQGDFIVTGFEECKIRIHYIGLPLDKEGLPLIIDDYNYREYIFWHVLQYFILNGYKIPDVNLGVVESMKTKYLPLAQNAPKMPSIDAMEAFANTMLRYTGRRKQYQNFEVNFEQQEYLDL